MLVYLVRNTKNGKAYVGQTGRELSRRWYEHCQLLGKCRALENAIRKYGAESFEISEVARVGSQEELNRLERLTCEALKTYSPNGYNLREGGGAVGRMHDETKKLLKALALSPKRLAAFVLMKGSPAVRAKLAARSRERGPDSVARMRAGITVETEERRIEATKKAWANADLRQAQRLLQTEIQARPEVKAKKSASLVATYAAMTDEARAARGKDMSGWLKGHTKKIDRSPEAKAKRSAIKAALWADPEHRAKMIAANSDPEVVKRRGDAIRAGHARRRAAAVSSTKGESP